MPKKYIRGIKQLHLVAHDKRHKDTGRGTGAPWEGLYLGHLAEVGKALSTIEGPTSEGV